MYQKLAVIICIMLSLSVIAVQSAHAQDEITLTSQSWDAVFRDHLTFHMEAEALAEIVEVNLFYRIVGRPASSRNEAEFTPGTSVSAEFVLDQTRPENYLPPGTNLEFWWRITDVAGNELRTEAETLLYLDNRYEWVNLQNERLTLYWYEGGDSFGQALFDRANLALDTLERDVQVTVEQPIRIFIYANQPDLMGAIATNAQEWTGGQAFTRYAVVVIGIRPNQLDWGLNAMTHEVTHLVIHQATENPFGDMPRWLDEGIAVYNENREALDDDFRAIFDRAVRNNELMTLRSLSSPFPADPLEANLAYGQSGAVVKFMIDTYGPETMNELLNIFAEGALYDEALEQALGLDTDGLDNTFRLSLGLPLLPGTEAPAPTVINPVTAETDEQATAEEDMPAVEAEVPAEAEPPAPAEDVAPIPPAEPAPEPASSPIALPCLAGMLPLLLVGGVVMSRFPNRARR